MSIVSVVRSIRGKFHSHFASSRSETASKCPSKDTSTPQNITNNQQQSLSNDMPLVDSETPDEISSDHITSVSSPRDMEERQPRTKHRNHHRFQKRPVKRAPSNSSTSSDDDISINEVKRSQMIRDDRHRRRRAHHSARSKKQLGIPVSSGLFTPVTTTVEELPATSSLASGISLPHFQTTLRVDPSWSLTDKLIQVKLAAYVSELYPGDDFDYEDSESSGINDTDLLCAVVEIGYGVPSLYTELEKLTGLDVANASRRLERIVARVIEADSESSDYEPDTTAYSYDYTAFDLEEAT